MFPVALTNYIHGIYGTMRLLHLHCTRRKKENNMQDWYTFVFNNKNIKPPKDEEEEKK